MSITSFLHFGAGTPPRTLKRSRSNTPIKQEEAESSNSALQRSVRVKREGSPVIKKEESRSPSPVRESPLSALRNQVRDVVRRFGNEKTEFPKGNYANARGKQRLQVQQVIEKARTTLNRLPSPELDAEVGQLRNIASKEAPTTNAKNWFSRGTDSLNLGKLGFYRDGYHSKQRGANLLSPNLQNQAQIIDDNAEEIVTQQPHIRHRLQNANLAHENRLRELYGKYRRLDLNNQGPQTNPQSAQLEALEYSNSERLRQAEIAQRVLTLYEN